MPRPRGRFRPADVFNTRTLISNASAWAAQALKPEIHATGRDKKRTPEQRVQRGETVPINPKGNYFLDNRKPCEQFGGRTDCIVRSPVGANSAHGRRIASTGRSYLDDSDDIVTLSLGVIHFH